ncbi:MAG TPA: homoserine O-succinyltransferase [Muribaculum sp.]|jgi:homoserine O-succinyltransferase|uniref:Homoserine O-acetyltransferase n=1 Tax=Heminiphilus faecis TaxID=2601703 RepID=A0ABV4CWS0_9BACT|nr:homoserine O-succinyltransferase [Heminiphilus faecis]RLT76867.1 homoserine O-succinyltransferase [bacterium J10(2018)]HRF68147.1 homoserine O-succinyltransferase [Muribaculum sp.]
MPVRVPVSLPAVEMLKEENIFVIDEQRASSQDIRPLRIGILNLMPLKIMTETDLLRLISNTPLQVELDLIDTASHVSRNTPREHVEEFYKTFEEIKDLNYDGFIITGAPVEKVDFEEVDYWDELCDIFDWARTHVTSTLYICWAAFAGLYHHYGVPKHVIDRKISGVFPHRVNDSRNPIFRGFDDEFYVPHSRFSEVLRDEVEQVKGLDIIAESPESGVYMVMARNGREFFITGHSEYSPYTLDFEYRRDTDKGMNPAVPAHYYIDDDPSKGPIVRWRSHANLLFSNWLNYFVYQETPYDIRDIHS